MKINLCITCNNELNYFPKYNDDSNNHNIFIDCFNEEPEGYYFNNIDNIYMPCFTIFRSNNICNECYSNSIFNYTKCYELCDYNFDKCYLKDIKYLKTGVNIINKNSNNIIISYEINTDINELKKLYSNFTFIEVNTELKDFLISQFNLDKENDKIYILIIDYPSNDLNCAINDYNYKFFLENGTELILSNIKEDFYTNIYVTIQDLDLANFNYSLYFAEQGYDIYDKNSNFYNDICSKAYINESDITLRDRKRDIYPNNITLCKDNCYYSDIIREEKKIICKCNLNENNSEINENDDFLNEKDDGNFFTYLLDNINYKIFKCGELLFNFENLKTNFAFYGILSILSIFLIINLILYICELSRIKKLMLKEAPKNRKRISNYSIKKRIKSKKKIKKYSCPIKKKSIKHQKTFSKYTNKNVKKRKSKSSKKSIKSELNNPSTIKFIKKKSKKSIEINQKEDLNELPYTLAIKQDKRNFLKIFMSIIVQKLEFINLFFGEENIKIILICQYILSLLINFFFNTLLYSDAIISNSYHNNGELEFMVSIILSLLSNIITSIFCYFINCSKEIEESIEQIKEIKIKSYYIQNLDIFFKKLKIKNFIFFIKQILIISLCFYYIVIFLIVYSYSRISLLFNYLSSLVEGLITSVAISIIIVITRKIGLLYLNRYLYNTSKYINNKF